MKHILTRGLVAALAVFLSVHDGHAQTAPEKFPERPIHIVLNGAPGGGLDILSRLLGEHLQETWRQPVVTENRPGAGGNIAFNAVAKSAPDGYTLLLSTDGITATPSLGVKGSVDPSKDFEAVTLLALTTDALLVRADSEIKTLADFARVAKQRAAEGKPLTIGTPGAGTSSHLTGALYGLRAGIQWTHVPYKGGMPAVTDLLAGHIDALWILAAPVVPHVKSGKLRALAVASEARNAALPDVPTIGESGLPGFAVVNWLGVLAPAGTPKPVIETLHTELSRLARDPALRGKLLEQGFVPDGRGSEALSRQIKHNVELWADTIEKANIRAN
jgi:tripartite-type tricarboxylate transporter receptor subunit TctC